MHSTSTMIGEQFLRLDGCSPTKFPDWFPSLPPAVVKWLHSMMTLWHVNSFHITGPLWGKSTGHQSIPHTKGRQWGALIVTLLLAWITCWISTRVAGDLGRHVAQVTSLLCMRECYSFKYMYNSYWILIYDVRWTYDVFTEYPYTSPELLCSA